MQFYFCEKCGKRVTDADLDSGRARNKQLKGMYCADCATGVLTMEMAPITVQDAKKILSQTSAPQRETPAQGRVQRTPDDKPSEARLTPAVRSTPKPARTHERESATPATPLLAAGVAGLLCLALAGWLLFGSRTQRTAAAPEAKSAPIPPHVLLPVATSPALPTSGHAVKTPSGAEPLAPAPLPPVRDTEEKPGSPAAEPPAQLAAPPRKEEPEPLAQIPPPPPELQAVPATPASPAPILDPARTEPLVPGLYGTYYADDKWSKVAGQRVDATLDFTWGDGVPLPGVPGDYFSVRWKGKLRVAARGKCVLVAEADDQLKVMVGGQERLMAVHRSPGLPSTSQAFDLEAGDHNFEAEFLEKGGAAVVKLYWERDGAAREIIPASTFWHDAKLSNTQLPLGTYTNLQSQADHAADALLQQTCNALSKRGSDEAAALVRADSTSPAELREALGAALAQLAENSAKEKLALNEALKQRVGQEVRLDTVKGPVSGKLVSFEPPALRLERTFVINGESQGTTASTVLLEDLSVAARRVLAPSAEPSGPPGWAALALAALAGGDYSNAESTLARCDGHLLQTPLRRLLDSRRMAGLDAKAEAVWLELEPRLRKASAQAQAKPLLKELAAYEAQFSGAEWARDEQRAALRATLKEELQRLADGVDPRLAKLFKGRITAYEPRSMALTLEYDFSSKEQNEDFVGAAPESPKNSGTRKDGMLLQCLCSASDLSLPLQFPCSAPGEIEISVSYKDYAGDCFVVGFFTQGTPPPPAGRLGIIFRGSTASLHQIGNSDSRTKPGPVVASRALPNGPLPKTARIDISCKDKRFVVRLNSDVVLDHTHTAAPVIPGLCLGGSAGSQYVLTHLKVTCRLDPRWLEKALPRK